MHDYVQVKMFLCVNRNVFMKHVICKTKIHQKNMGLFFMVECVKLSAYKSIEVL